MSKIVLLIGFTLLSLVYAVLDYLQCVRYCETYIYPMDSYLKNYKNITKLKDTPKIVITINTTADRIGKIEPTLKSLLDQTIRVDQIDVNVPEGDADKIDSKFSKIVSIYELGKDYGECKCIVPTLMREGESDTIVIYLKDDVVYGKSFLYNLVKKSKENPDKAIFYDNDTILVKPKFFDADSYSKKYDKNWIENNLNVPKMKISYFSNYKKL